jgi:hypothetical protein
LTSDSIASDSRLTAAGEPPGAGLQRDGGHRHRDRELQVGLTCIGGIVAAASRDRIQVGIRTRVIKPSVTRANLRLPTCTT